MRQTIHVEIHHKTKPRPSRGQNKTHVIKPRGVQNKTNVTNHVIKDCNDFDDTDLERLFTVEDFSAAEEEEGDNGEEGEEGGNFDAEIKVC